MKVTFPLHVIAGMVCISVLISLFHATLILVAEPGDDVTLWYQHEQTTPTYISWFKHTDSSVPVYISCQYFRNNSASSHCSFVNQSKRTVMSVNSQYTSLTITAVNPTDSGLYYCGIRRGSQISFSNYQILITLRCLLHADGSVYWSDSCSHQCSSFHAEEEKTTQ
uniref:Ig-like domain-containing protein n=1 Tax=Electrophorus electricus TaxID=8005 RepID=A0A4W4G703_ELEEL